MPPWLPRSPSCGLARGAGGRRLCHDGRHQQCPGQRRRCCFGPTPTPSSQPPQSGALGRPPERCSAGRPERAARTCGSA
eukprot:12584622-Alexandrium_andersonii.AAC.1